MSSVVALRNAYVTHDVVFADLYLVLRLRCGDDQLAIDRKLALALRMTPRPINGSFQEAVLDIDVWPRLDHLAGHLAALAGLTANRLANGDLASSVCLLLAIKLFGKSLVDVPPRADLFGLAPRAAWKEACASSSRPSSSWAHPAHKYQPRTVVAPLRRRA
jgi:hypothetical protein